jgi:hypothetical protein
MSNWKKKKKKRKKKVRAPTSGAPAKVTGKLIEEFAGTHKVELPTAERVIWLSRVLHAISASPISKDFALMGGSAIVFLYREMYRLSTDLDLDFIGNKNLGRQGASEIERRLKMDRTALQRVARELGVEFSVLRAKPGERFVQYELEYRSEYARRASVELDVSYRYCHSVLGPVSRPWPIYFGEVVPKFSVQSLKMEELYASKILAMVDFDERLDFPGKISLMFKRKIRHLFDVYLLADEVFGGHCRLDLKMIRILVLLFGMTRIKNFEFLAGSVVGSYTDEDIKGDLKSVVPSGVLIPTVDEMKWTVRKLFDDHLFKWTKPEHRFIEDFRAKNFRPEDLFGSGPVAQNLHGMQYYREIMGRVRTI